MLGKGDKPEKRPVTVGKRNDKQVEILQGLAEGDQVLLERPKDSKHAVAACNDRFANGAAVAQRRASPWERYSGRALRLTGQPVTRRRFGRDRRTCASCPPSRAMPWAGRLAGVRPRSGVGSARAPGRLAICLQPPWPKRPPTAALPTNRPRPTPRRPTGPKPKPVAPPPAKEIDAAIHRGVEFLLKRQNANGSWGSERSSAAGRGLRPGARRASGLPRGGDRAVHLGADRDGRRRAPRSPRPSTAARRGCWSTCPRSAAARPTCIYNNWAHAYVDPGPGADAPPPAGRRRAVPQDPRADRAADRHAGPLRVRRRRLGLLRLQRPHAEAQRLDDQLRHGHGAGGPATRRKQAGIEVPERLVDRAMASIRRQRKPDFSYVYGEYLKYRPMLPVNRPGGSLGRSQACNLAMRLWGDKAGDRRGAARPGSTGSSPATSGSTSAASGRSRTSRGSRWPATSSTTATTTRRCASSSFPPAERGPYQDQLAHVLLPLAGEGRLVVGLPVLRLPPAVRHGLRADVAGTLLSRGFRKTQPLTTRNTHPFLCLVLCQFYAKFNATGYATLIVVRCPVNENTPLPKNRERGVGAYA